MIGIHFGLALLRDILAGEYGPVEIDTSIIPSRTRDMFLRKDFMVSAPVTLLQNGVEITI